VVLPNLNKGGAKSDGKGLTVPEVPSSVAASSASAASEVDEFRMPQRLDHYEPTDANVPGSVRCKDCNLFVRHWRYTWNTVTYIDAATDNDDDKVQRHHTCVRCLMRATQQSYHESMRDILGQKTTRSKKRCEDFEAAKAHMKEDLSFTGSNKQLKKIARTTFLALFAPIAALIMRKRAKVEMSCMLHKKHEEIMVQISKYLEEKAPASQTEPLLQQLQQLEKDIDAAESPVAWGRHPPKVSEEFAVASSYFDEWQRTGQVWLRSWYICSCGCVQSSLTWRRRFAALEGVSKQRWYCQACGRRYKTAMGQLVEFAENGADPEQTFWSLATIPPPAVEDLRGMKCEEEIAPRTPQGLLDAIEQHVPVQGSILRLAKRDDLWEPDAVDWEEKLKGMCFLKPNARALLEQRPFFDWNQILLATEG
jgi:hypothetical protein